jgi:glyoxylase-like metal-dependent hydrolase (beta-lactamase superfamily II)
MRIQAIQTGAVAIKADWREGVGHGAARNARAILGRAWTDPLPIYAWVIEHPEGLIVVDTGETARAAQPGYFPWWHPVFRLAVRERLTPDDEIGPQLRRLGYDPNEVRWVVMTHLHTDHAGGLQHFPRSDILVTRQEYSAAVGRAGILRGYQPQHWPTWFQPHLIDFAERALGPFTASYPLTRAGDIQLVSTPGHSTGHMSVFVHDDATTIVCAGDVSYTQELMLAQKIDGVSPDEKQAYATLRSMARYTQEHPTIYLPSHDPDSAQRLEQRVTVPKLAVAS